MKMLPLIKYVVLFMEMLTFTINILLTLLMDSP